MQSSQEQLKQLQQEFKDFGYKLDQPIDKRELKNFLDKKTNGLFDEDIFEQLIERIANNYKQPLSVDIFLTVLMEADDQLTQKIQNLKQDIENQNSQKKQINLQLDQEKKKEILNQYQIMIGSQLIVKIGSVKGNRQNEAIYVDLRLGNQNQQTQKKIGYTIQWNQNFNFDVTTGDESLIISINSADDRQLGNISADLPLLRDQQSHQELLSIDGLDGFQIEINIQWIWSKVIMYQDYIQNLDENIKANFEDLENFQIDIKNLMAPFKSLKPQKRISSNDIAQNQQPIQNIRTQQQFTPIQEDPNAEYAYQIHPILEKKRYLKKDSLLAFRLCLLFIFIIDLFVSFDKCIFIDMLIIVGIMALWEQNKLNIQNSKYAIYAMVFSWINDIIWLSIWFNGAFSNDLAGGGVLQFVCIMSIIFIFIKFACILLLGQYTHGLTLQNSGLDDSKQFQFNGQMSSNQ